MPRNPQADDLAKAVGHALAAWSFVEICVSSIVAEMDVVETNSAHIIMASVIAFDARVNVCTNLLVQAKQGSAIELWSGIAARLMKLHTSRHQFAHFSFVTQYIPNKPVRVRLIPFFSSGNHLMGKPMDGLGVSEIDDFEARCWEMADAVMWFREAYVSAPSPDRPLRPEPDLIARIRELAVQKRAKQRPQPQA